MKRVIAFFVALACIAACGGATSSSGSPDGGTQSTTPAACEELADSGFTCEACLGSRCCTPLLACQNDPDGLPFVQCVTNCLETADAGSIGNCQPSCEAAHPNGGAACMPYYTCAAQQCVGKGC
jgi:hypothetical protein